MKEKSKNDIFSEAFGNVPAFKRRLPKEFFSKSEVLINKNTKEADPDKTIVPFNWSQKVLEGKEKINEHFYE